MANHTNHAQSLLTWRDRRVVRLYEEIETMTYYTTKETAVINVISGMLLMAVFATPAHCQTTARQAAEILEKQRAAMRAKCEYADDLRRFGGDTREADRACERFKVYVAQAEQKRNELAAQEEAGAAESPQQKAMIDAHTAWDKAVDTMKATREALDRAEYARDNACAGHDESSLECRSARERVETAKAAHGEALSSYDRAKTEVNRAADDLEKAIKANARAARKAHDERYARMQKAAYSTTRAYAAFLARIYPKFNNISAEFNPDTGLLTGYHSFFTRYAFDIGPQGPAVARWIAAHKTALKRLGIVAVGVSDSENSRNSVHYDVQ
jgi:hypothetical protein